VRTDTGSVLNDQVMRLFEDEPSLETEVDTETPVFSILEEYLDGEVIALVDEAVALRDRGDIEACWTLMAAIFFQVSYALFCAQSWFGFQHNDLHHQNVRFRTLESCGERGEDWHYEVPVANATLHFALPHTTTKARRVVIFDFGLSQVSGVALPTELPETVDLFTPLGFSGEPHAEEQHSVQDGVAAFPTATSPAKIRWFRREVHRVDPEVVQLCRRYAEDGVLVGVHLDPNRSEAGALPDVPLGRQVAGYDMAVFARHLVLHCKAMQSLMAPDASPQDDTAQAEFVAFVRQAMCIDAWEAFTQHTFTLDGFQSVGLHFGRPRTPEQEHPSMASQDAMSRLLSSPFLSRWLRPRPTRRFTYRDADDAGVSDGTLIVPSVPSPSDNVERSEIARRLSGSRVNADS